MKIDKQLSPFNIGKAIQITGFNYTEAQPLISGLNSKFSHPEVILKEILNWTKGQPFLTQKLCYLVVKYSEQEQINIPQLIQHRLVDNWEIQDEPEHLKTICDRLLNNQQNKARLLTLYHSIAPQIESQKEPSTPDPWKDERPQHRDSSRRGNLAESRAQLSMREMLAARGVKGFCQQMPKVSQAEIEKEERAEIKPKTNIAQMSLVEINDYLKDPILRKQLMPPVGFWV